MYQFTKITASMCMQYTKIAVSLTKNNYSIFRTITRTTDNPQPRVFYHKKKRKLTDCLHRHTCIIRTPIHSFLPRISSH